MTASAASRASRLWSTVSLMAGGLWLVLSLTPFFLTTLLGLPVAALAFVSGWLGRRSAEPGAVRRANWGLGLGCAGCLWQVIYYAVLGGVLLAGLPSLIEYIQKTPTP